MTELTLPFAFTSDSQTEEAEPTSFHLLLYGFQEPEKATQNNACNAFDCLTQLLHKVASSSLILSSAPFAGKSFFPCFATSFIALSQVIYDIHDTHFLLY